MTIDLRQALAGVPEAQPADDLEAAIADSVAYLGSDAALRSIETDTYWPKWHSPWWHMLALHELGEARRIPGRVVTAMVDGLNALPFKIFPIGPDEAPGADRWRDSTCHCALGNIYQALTACGVDVDAALPWIRPWFLRYQMADGGLNCDETAYLVEDECPSSMVGTIAPFEAMLLGSTWTEDRRAFLDRAAGFLIARELRLGSPSVHNAVERTVATIWLRPCFPRFYFYDVLRGLAALVRWAERTDGPIPRRAVARVIEHLVAEFPDGAIRLERHGTASCPTTRAEGADGTWVRVPTTSFPLLDTASVLGKPCAASTRQWSATRRGLLALFDAGRIID
ncbi:MAG TPA: hypothetical protein VKE22_04140 [Haliangiales bacterium]|nr:hypothetical protein [Haliangiales bacterium]